VAFIEVPKFAFFNIDQVQVTGTSAVPDLLVRNKIQPLLQNQTIFTVDDDAIVKEVEHLPFVRHARVDHHLPGGISIDVDEYRPLAIGLGDGKAWLVALDGRILSQARLADWINQVPAVRLEAESIQAGQRVGNEPALRVLRALPPTFPGTIRGVEVDDVGLMTAYMHEGPAIRLGRDTDLVVKLQVAERLMSLYGPAHIGAVQYVDVSVPERPAAKVIG
jgi:cell division septal protein FtsQ